MDLIYKAIYSYYCRKRYQILTKQLNMQEVDVDMGGHTIRFYHTPNQGMPILFIHGLLDASFGFRKLVPYLDPSFQVWLVDIPGFGKSRMPKVKYLYQLDIISELIYKAIQKLPISTIILAGHSMGGLIAQHIALKDIRRGMIQKLILLSTGHSPHPDRDKMRSILFPKTHEEVERLLQYLYFKEKDPPTKFVREVLIREWNSTEYQYLAENTIEKERYIFLGRRSEDIGIPTLILCGRHDGITTISMMKKLKYLIRRSRLTIVHQAKHAIHLERPEEVAGHINDFIFKLQFYEND